MVKKYVIKVDWLSAKEGGRKDSGLSICSTTQYYYCTTVLDYDPPTWSVRLESIEKDNNELFHLTFLFETYPKIFNCNNKLSLYEGPKLVAKAVITDIIRMN